ncbi:MAG: hypothetical protein ACMXYG_00435 [Candidatus Woesearchaeota archaeon]
MEIVLFLQYLIIGIISFSGLLVGKLLALIAPEEIFPGKRNLILFQKVIFVLLSLVFIFVLDILWIRIVILILLAYFLFRVKIKSINTNNNYYLLYTAIGLFLGMTSIKYLIYPAFLIFLLGIPIAVFNRNQKLNVFIKIFLVFFIFYIMAFLYII